MSRRLDYSDIWADTKKLLATHRDGVVAIAALFLFLPDWVARLFAGQPDIEDAETPAEILTAFQTFYADNWALLLPTGLLSLFGVVALYVLLTRKDLPTVGAALGKAVAFLPFYFAVQLASGLATIAGLLLLLLPGLYIAGRLTPLAAVSVAERDRGFVDVIMRAWNLTQGNGWLIFFFTWVVALLASLTAIVAGLLVGLLCRLITGAKGVPFVETGVDAAFGAAIATLMAALSVAIYRTLAGKD
jgi:hypothetical protein